MREAGEFTFRMDSPPSEVFAAVWRMDWESPGFAVLVPDAPLESRRARTRIVELAAAFADFAPGGPFAFERLGRFDQQVTTKFHRDGAPPSSLLLLAYEPTNISSRFFVADSEATARQDGIGVNAFLAAHNPMFPEGESRLAPFVTELKWPRELGAIVLVNNSQFPDGTASGVPLGVLHKGQILRADPSERRVINSAGLSPESSGRALSEDAVGHFVHRDDLD